MKEIQRDLHEDLKIMTLIPKDPDEPVDMVHDVVTPHAIRRAIAAEEEVERLTAENTVKSAAIKKYENDAEYWYQESEKARSMFLATHVEKVRLRKALEDARAFVRANWDKTAIRVINDALGEEVES